MRDSDPPPETLIEVVSVNFKLALRRPGYETIRFEAINWAAINEWLVKMAGKRDYPYGTVVTVTDWKGTTNKFLVTGGKSSPPKITQLAYGRVRPVADPVSRPAP